MRRHASRFIVVVAVAMTVFFVKLGVMDIEAAPTQRTMTCSTFTSGSGGGTVCITE